MNAFTPGAICFPGRRSGILPGLLLAAACGSGEGPVANGRGPEPGAMLVQVDGLPANLSAQVTVAGPGGFSRVLAASDALTGLTPGTYTVSAGPVTAGDQHLWAPTPERQSVQVVSATHATATVTYAITTGALTVSVVGLPAGTPADLTLSGPSGFTRVITATTTLTGLAPGNYALAGGAVVVGTARWAPTVPEAPIAVEAGTTPASATVAFARVVGRLALEVVGLPAGVTPDLTLAGPGGTDLRPVAGTIEQLDPGTYTLTARPVAHAGHTWVPVPASQPVEILGAETSSATIQYTVTTGGLTVMVQGVPSGAAVALQVTGPDGFTASLTSTHAFVGLAPGVYTVAAAPLVVAGHRYEPVPPTAHVTVSASTTPSLQTVEYVLVTGALRVTVAGLPTGTSGAIAVTGPAGFTRAVTETESLLGLQPGQYTITASTVTAAGATWVPTPATRTLSVSASLTPVDAPVTYTEGVGALALAITGLPAGVQAQVAVTGPKGTTQVGASQTLTALAPGSYTIAAATVVQGVTTYAPTPASQTRSVALGATTSAAVHYTVAAVATLNLRIDGFYLTQAVQKYDGSVPLVAGRDAYLRVFAVANESNAVAPVVRVRLYHGPALVQTYTIAAPGPSVPTAVQETPLTTTWNVLVPGALVQPGLAVLTDIDPAGGVVETNEADNLFPTSGLVRAVDVRTVPTFAIRFIPVLQQANGLQGNVSASTMAQFLAVPRQLLPVAGVDADLRTPYTTTAPVLQSDNGNSAWGTILSEVRALRTADGSARYYYGVVATTYGSGVAGIGYVGGSSRTALGWDKLPSATEVMAHELGHNMGRQHAPCGGAGNPDPNYPYAGGVIGQWGLDLATLALKSPTGFRDLMGYCGQDWVSDYNWAAMLTYRQAGPNNAPESPGTGLLVWGRLTPAGPVLEPAFPVEQAPRAPAPGPHLVEGFDDRGRVVWRVPFSADPVADGMDESAFAFIAPDLPVAGIRLVSEGQVVTRSRGAAPPPSWRAERAGGAAVLRWDASRWPMVLVRDAESGQILSFARGGEVRLPIGSGRFRLLWSDGVRGQSETTRLR